MPQGGTHLPADAIGNSPVKLECAEPGTQREHPVKFRSYQPIYQPIYIESILDKLLMRQASTPVNTFSP